jgi:hypothetical protein
MVEAAHRLRAGSNRKAILDEEAMLALRCGV